MHTINGFIKCPIIQDYTNKAQPYSLRLMHIVDALFLLILNSGTHLEMPSNSPANKNLSTLLLRFWEHHSFTKSDYDAHINYCYMNPVKHGLVSNVKDWEYSTFHRDVKKGLYPIDWYSEEYTHRL